MPVFTGNARRDRITYGDTDRFGVTLTFSPDTPQDTVIRALGGRDIVTGIREGTVLGGAGNDWLTASYDWTTQRGTGVALYGGTGHDVLTGTDGVNMFGGNGTDVLTLTDLNGGNSLMQGGHGNDVLTVNARDDGRTVLRGGSGADSFDLQGFEAESGATFVLSDFTRRDRLTLEDQRVTGDWLQDRIADGTYTLTNSAAGAVLSDGTTDLVIAGWTAAGLLAL